MSKKEKSAYNNLILLCANCHTVIDKAPGDYPVSVLTEWKSEHTQKIQDLFGVAKHPDREAVRHSIEPLLATNRRVFEEYGPNNDYRFDPESESATVWKRKMLAVILPNNHKILKILDVNREHITEEESLIVENFRQHIDDLKSKHVGGHDGTIARQFPEKMCSILE
ncbi:MAG: hypothetical protein ACF8MF_05870 [Phycisphaerales bacterium JB052]